MALRTDRAGYLIMFGALCALPPLSIDMALPAMTAIQHGFGVSAGSAGLTLSVFLAGFTITPLAYGLLSDRLGRRPLLIAGLVLFVVGGLGCATAPSISWLLAARLLQGAGAGAGPTIAFAATRDLLTGPAMGRRLAALTMMLNTAPVVAPSLGAVVLTLAGWRSIYAVITAAGLLVLLAITFGFGETRQPAVQPIGQPIVQPGVAGLGAVMRRLASEQRTLTFGSINGLASGTLFGWIAGSPLVMIGHFGVSATTYGWLFAAAAIAIIGGAFLSGRLARRLSASAIVASGLMVMLGAAVLAAALIAGNSATLATLYPCMAAVTFGFGLITPPASHAALDPVPDISGTAAALMSTFQTACMSLASLVVALLFERIGVMAMPLTMIAFSLAAATVLLGGSRVTAARVAL